MPVNRKKSLSQRLLKFVIKAYVTKLRIILEQFFRDKKVTSTRVTVCFTSFYLWRWTKRLPMVQVFLQHCWVPCSKHIYTAWPNFFSVKVCDAEINALRFMTAWPVGNKSWNNWCGSSWGTIILVFTPGIYIGLWNN